MDFGESSPGRASLPAAHAGIKVTVWMRWADLEAVEGLPEVGRGIQTVARI
jgi:hypothetical protein